MLKFLGRLNSRSFFWKQKDLFSSSMGKYNILTRFCGGFFFCLLVCFPQKFPNVQIFSRHERKVVAGI